MLVYLVEIWTFSLREFREKKILFEFRREGGKLGLV